MRHAQRTSWELVGFAALLVLLAGMLMVSAGLAQGPGRVLYPVKATETKDRAQPRVAAPQDWRVAEGVTYENLTVFPILARAEGNTSGYLTLDEGLSSGQVVVAESGAEIIRRSRDGRPVPMPPVYSGGANVNKLVLVNRSSRPLVLLAGEVVSGGKQDRVIAKDRIVAPGSEPLPLDVFCVEHGRWTGAAAFAEAKIIVHPSVREKANFDRKQDEVWAAVRSGSTAASAQPGSRERAADAAAGNAAPMAAPENVRGVIASEARSENYGKVYREGRIGQSVESFTAEIERRFARATSGLKGERVVGVVIAYGGEVAWSDAFASGDLFAKYWPKLLRSYVVEALARPRTQERATLEDARDFLSPLRGHEQVESEPGVYRWRQISAGRYSEIELSALPKEMMLHRVKIQRTS
jgi:hypothetical protein